MVPTPVRPARSLLRSEPYRCQGKDNCNIRAGKRKICPKCRHKKCIAVGMSREAIKTGRYTHAKRTQDILEFRQMMGIHSEINYAQTASGVILTSEEQAGNPALACQSSDCDSTQTTMSSPSILTSSCEENTDALDSVSLLQGPFELSSPVSPLTLNSLDHLTRPDEVLSQSFKDNFSDSATSSELTAEDTCVQPSPDSSQSPDRDENLLDDAECERVVIHLLQAHKKIIPQYPEGITAEKILEMQKKCCETCRLRTAIFGSLSLTEEEYQEFYRETGLDADNRQPMVKEFVTKADKNIRCYVSFVKNIPGFKDLNINDQIKLIKDNRLEFKFMCHYRGVNCEMKVLTFPSGHTMCIHDMSKVWGKEQFLKMCECVQVIRRLCLSAEEMVILECLMVVTLGSRDVDEPDKVSALQWRMAQCLIWTLKRTRSNVGTTFAAIISAVCRLRELCVEVYKWIKTNPFKDYQLVQENDLLAEWFSDS